MKAVNKLTNYQDASKACPWCGMIAIHTKPRDCVADLAKTFPLHKVPRLIQVIREELAMIEGQ